MKSEKANQFDDKDRIQASIMAVFPNLETYQCFIEDNDKSVLTSFIRYAKHHDLIQEPSEEAFKSFISEKQISKADGSSVKITFKDFLKEFKVISFRRLVDRSNDLVKKHGLNMPSISHTMLSRLNNEPANTPNKRNLLRVLAFWIGHERTQLASFWNYETLVMLCPKEQSIKSNEGVKILFSLHSRGDVINEGTIKWLRKELKDCIKELNIKSASLEGGDVFQVTEFLVKIIKDSQFEEGFSHPKAYGHCVRNAIAIAHQLSIRWTLSPYHSPRKFVTIGIAAGVFSELDIHLKTLVNSKLMGDPMIRITEFTHLCVLINNIRVICCENPQKIEMTDGGVLTVWWFLGVWSMLYWDFAPILLKEEMLPIDKEAKAALKELLWLPDEFSSFINNSSGLRAIITFLKFPQNSILGIEIAKTFYYRRMFFEADEIVRIILSAEPYNIVARILRLNVFSNLGVFENLPYSISKIHFKRAEEEAFYIQERCPVDEDYYCEYGLSKLDHALRIFRILRYNEIQDIRTEPCISKDRVCHLLFEAHGLFEKGVTISPTGYRCLYWIVVTQCLLMMLNSNEKLFSDPDEPFLDKNNICINVAQKMFTVLGWLPLETSGLNLSDFDYLNKRLYNALLTFSDSILIRSEKPMVYFIFPILFWDWNPVIDVKRAKEVIRWLKESVSLSQNLEKDSLDVFSLLRFSPEIIEVPLYVRLVEKIIDEIEKRIGTLESLEKRDEIEIIDQESIGGFKIFSFLIGDKLQR